MKDFEIKKTNGDFEVTQTWKFKEIKSPQVRTFQWADEPEVIHIIKTGFEDRYLVVWEDAYEMMLGSTSVLTKKEIKNKFDIEL